MRPPLSPPPIAGAPHASPPPPDLPKATAALTHMRVSGLVLLGTVLALVVFIVLVRLPGPGFALPPSAAVALVVGFVAIWVIAPLWFVIASVRFARAMGESVVVVGGLTLLLAPLSFPFTYAHARHILRRHAE